MTSQSPRIYTYKITFEEVPYYYYGVKKEEYYNQEYWGSPKTNKWCWELYTPKKQILEVFDFTDEGWLEGQDVEKRLIKPVFNTDKWCLNESCGGTFSLDILRKTGRRSGLQHKENGTGIFSITPEERSEHSRKIGLKSYENGTGIFSITPEERSEIGRRSGLKNKENGTGVCGMSKEQLSEIAKKTNAQKWMCLETGHISTPGGLTKYQRNRGIDTSKRKRIK
jgi:general stress protein YciG